MRLILAAVLGFAACQTYGFDQPMPSSDELVKKFIQRSQEEDNQKLDDKYGYIEHRLHDDLDKNGNPKQHFDRTFQRVMLEGRPFSRLIAIDGKPLSADEQAKQAAREKAVLEARQKKSAETKKKNADDDFQIDEQFMGHFKFDIVGREAINGRDSYIVTVLPKPSGAPVRNNTEKMFVHMQGKVWVDAQDYSLAKCDIHLSEPTSFYGFLGSVRQLDFVMQRRWVDEKVWMTEKLKFAIDGRRLTTAMRMRQESTYSDYKKLPD
jgi:hypothetical protein